MIFSIIIILTLSIYFGFLVYKSHCESELLVQKEINKELAAHNPRFNIIKNNATFSDQSSTQVFSEIVEFHPITSSAKIVVNNLYQSTITNKFFWYKYAVIKGTVVEEQILLDEEDMVKQFLLEKDIAIYLKIFGQPKPY